MTEKRTIAEPSAEARLLYAHLATTKEGDVLTWDAIQAACGVDVRRFRGALTTARRWLLKRDGILFLAVAGVGVQRAGNTGKLAEMDQRKRRISTQARKGLRVAQVVDVSSMTSTERVHHAAIASIFAAAQHASAHKTERAISSKITEGKPLALAETLQALRNLEE